MVGKHETESKSHVTISRQLKVVHLVAGSLQDGAHRGAYWLHRGLLELGVESSLLTTSTDTLNDPTVYSMALSRRDKLKIFFVKRLDKLLIKLYPHREKRIFSTGFWGLKFFNHPAYKAADIVHLHWINGLATTKAIGQIDKPVLWTLRDMWPMTGGCHYAMNCERFKEGCGQCPQLGSKSPNDLSRRVAKQKKKQLPPKLLPVGISHWITEQASQSPIFANHCPVTVFNNVDTRAFYPLSQKQARSALNITCEKKLILLGATDTGNFYKGFNKALEALKILDKKKYALCVFGKVDKKMLDETGYEFTSLGYVQSNEKLRLAYCAADVFLAPSIMEAFGKTIAESIACATPVVCFNATGPKSIIVHKEDGYKADPFSEQDLAKGIEWVTQEANHPDLKRNARQNALKKFDSVVVAKQYRKLYEQVIA